MINEKFCYDCWFGDSEAVKMTLQLITQFSFQGYNENGETALFCAAVSNQIQVIILLLKHKGMFLRFDLMKSLFSFINLQIIIFC